MKQLKNNSAIKAFENSTLGKVGMGLCKEFFIYRELKNWRAQDKIVKYFNVHASQYSANPPKTFTYKHITAKFDKMAAMSESLNNAMKLKNDP